MIVLDEHLKGAGIGDEIARWYQGAVTDVTALRPGSVIKDSALPSLLRRVREPTFVTINTTDFWGQMPAHRRHCIVCLDLPHHRAEEIPALLRRLLQLPEFRTKSARMGKVVRVGASGAWYYDATHGPARFVPWLPTPNC